MRVFVAVDMEGATGVAHRDHVVPGGRDYERARKWLTGDVRAAVEGAVAAGADEVWVSDGHGDMRNLIVDDLPEAARVVIGPAQSRNRPLVQMTGIDDGDFAACLFVGFHSRAGTPGGLLSHTWVGALVHEIRLQGAPAGESLLDAAIAGHYGTPVVLVTGGDDVCREVRADLGDDVETVAVKRVLGTSACASLTPARAQREIREAAERAVRAREGRRPWTTTPPVVMEVEFHRREMREKALRANVGEATGERCVRYEAGDVPTAAKHVWRGLEAALLEDSSWLA